MSGKKLSDLMALLTIGVDDFSVSDDGWHAIGDKD
jgi:hypothetical protein